MGLLARTGGPTRREAMVDKKSLIYSAVLLVFLLVVSLLLNRGMVRAVLNPADISLSLAPFPTSTTSTLDNPREFVAELDFPDEEAAVSRLELIVSVSSTGATTTHFYLPLPATSSTSTISSPFTGQPATATGTLVVSVEFLSVVVTTTGGTLPSTLPGGQAYKGIGAGAKLLYTIKWTPPNDSSYEGDHKAVLVAHVVAPGGGGNIFTTAPVVFTILPVSVVTQNISLIMTITTTTVDEDESQFVVDIELVNPSTTPSTASFSAVGITATSGSDFGAPSASSVSLSQSLGTSTQITISVVNDAATPVREGNEELYALLSNPGGGVVITGGPGDEASTTLTIIDPI